MLPPQAVRPGAEPGLDRQFAHVVGELGGVLAPALAALPEQPRVGIGAQARHTAERALLLDDHGVEAVIVQPQRARHARGSAPMIGTIGARDSVDRGISRLWLHAA